jgi:serine-type D-Ala-D-Ala carboxypeptidase
MLSFDDIDQYIRQQIAAEWIPGAVLLIAKEQCILHHQAYGDAKKYELIVTSSADSSTDYLKKMRDGQRLMAQPITMTVDHLFDLASLTKVLATTFACMLLVDKGQLDLDRPIAQYLPEFNDPLKSTICARHLLSHTSGLMAWQPLYYHASHALEVLTYINGLALSYPIASKRQYSDLGFIILGLLIEHIVNMPLAEFLTQALFAPLQLKHTGYHQAVEGMPIVATSHGNPFEYKMIADQDFGYPCQEKIQDFTKWRAYTLQGEVNDGNAYYALNGMSGHAGLFSTAKDIHVLLNCLTNQGMVNGEQIISAQTIQTFMSKDQYGHGLGWAMSCNDPVAGLPIGDLADHPYSQGLIGHLGFTGTYILAIPQQKLHIILLTNALNAGVKADGRYQSLRAMQHVITQLTINKMMLLDHEAIASAKRSSLLNVHTLTFSKGQEKCHSITSPAPSQAVEEVAINFKAS